MTATFDANADDGWAGRLLAQRWMTCCPGQVQPIGLGGTHGMRNAKCEDAYVGSVGSHATEVNEDTMTMADGDETFDFWPEIAKRIDGCDEQDQRPGRGSFCTSRRPDGC